MFATPAVTFHTLLSLVAILAGIFVMSMLVKNRRPDVWTLVFLVTMIATDVTGFLLPRQNCYRRISPASSRWR